MKNDNEQSSPAIIDTGSSALGVPEHIFKNLHLEWKSDLQNKNIKLDCMTNENFCQVTEPCSHIKDILKPISFILDGKTLEVPPSVYLNQSPNAC